MRELIVRRKGINYDTGFEPMGDRLSRESFDPVQVRREVAIIAHDLHCTTVRISGREPERIALAAERALVEGLEVWFSPFPCNMTPAELVPYFVTCAQSAEKLRHRSHRVVFVLGCEMSLFNSGFVPGEDHLQRIQTMMNPSAMTSRPESPEEMEGRFRAFLAQTVAAVRDRFAGPMTYASGPWESVDWSCFDIVSVDLYRDAGNRASYRDKLRAYFAYGRPVAVTEFGCCTYRGAEDRGAMGWAIVDRSAHPPRLTEDVVRDEQVQADYLVELLDIFSEEGADGAFWFTFAGFENPHHVGPRRDLDCASFGVVKILEGPDGGTYRGLLPWEPKLSFHALAEYYSRSG